MKTLIDIIGTIEVHGFLFLPRKWIFLQAPRRRSGALPPAGFSGGPPAAGRSSKTVVRNVRDPVGEDIGQIAKPPLVPSPASGVLDLTDADTETAFVHPVVDFRMVAQILEHGGPYASRDGVSAECANEPISVRFKNPAIPFIV